MKINLKKLEEISCIKLNKADEERLLSDIEETLNSIESILKVDLTGEEQFLGFQKSLKLHDDKVGLVVPTQEVLMNTHHSKNMISVPKIIIKKEG